LWELDTVVFTFELRGDKHLFSSRDEESLFAGALTDASKLDASAERSPVGVLGGVGP
jgi:hypothetical protein